MTTAEGRRPTARVRSDGESAAAPQWGPSQLSRPASRPRVTGRTGVYAARAPSREGWPAGASRPATPASPPSPSPRRRPVRDAAGALPELRTVRRATGEPTASNRYASPRTSRTTAAGRSPTDSARPAGAPNGTATAPDTAAAAIPSPRPGTSGLTAPTPARRSRVHRHRPTPPGTP